MIQLVLLLLVVYLLIDRRRLRRERNRMQMLWFAEALAHREELAAAQMAFDQIMEEQYGATSERLGDGRILLPPMSLN